MELSSSSAKIGMPRMRSALGCAIAATLPFRRLAVTSRAVALPQLLDLELGPVQPLDARAMELLAAAPEGDRLVEGDVPPLELRDDVVQLALELLEGALLAHGRTSSTRAPSAPWASSTSTSPPAATVPALRTTAPPARTIAYPRASVASGERAGSRACEPAS